MKLNNIFIKIPTIVLGLHALINFFRGGAHFFLPDGGSTVIADLDIGSGDQKQIIITIFAVMGAGQIIWGALQCYILFYAKNMTAVILAFTTASVAMGTFALYIFKPLPITVPGHSNIYILIVLVIATIIAYRNQSMKDYP